jgi:hypothetical protein
MSDPLAVFVSVVAIAIAVLWKPLWGLVVALSHYDAASPVPPVQGPPVTPAKVSFPGAIDALAVVRNRLVETGCMNEPAAAAVEAITHALVLGTDK